MSLPFDPEVQDFAINMNTPNGFRHPYDESKGGKPAKFKPSKAIPRKDGYAASNLAELLGKRTLKVKRRK